MDNEQIPSPIMLLVSHGSSNVLPVILKYFPGTKPLLDSSTLIALDFLRQTKKGMHIQRKGQKRDNQNLRN